MLALRKIQSPAYAQPELHRANPAVAAAKPSPMQELEAMGFPRDISERALAQAGGNPVRAVELIFGGQIQEQTDRIPPPLSDEREISEAMQRLRCRPANDNLASSIWCELSKKKKDEGWTSASLQEAMSLYNLSSNEHAAQLYSDVMTGKLTVAEIARASAALAFGMLDDGPLERRQSAKGTCIVCGDEYSGSAMYSRICEAKALTSAHGGSAAPEKGSGGERNCMVCYPCLFDGLHFQFKANQLPLCVACNAPLHQTAFNEILSIEEANFSDCLGTEKLNNKVCTCGALAPSMFKGYAAQNPESIKTHAKECSFAVLRRMQNQADELLMKSALAGGENFVACPGANCANAVEVAVMIDPVTGKPIKMRECVQCRACSTTFCPKCGASPYHYNAECENIGPLRGDYSEWMARGRQAFLRQRAEMDASFQAQLKVYEADKSRVEAEKKQLEVVAQQAAADEAYKAANCKNCPSCGRIVMKMEGCDSMKCGQDYHGGNKQMGCGADFRWSTAPAYQAQDVQPRQVVFNREQPQQMLHKWQVCQGEDLPCDACAGPIVGPKFTCINCPSMNICATCEALGPQALQTRLNPQFHSTHKMGHLFVVEMPPE